jgi:hypothetical protein
MFTNDQLLRIHKALHNWSGTTRKVLTDSTAASHEKITYPLILTPRSHCRMVEINGYKFIEQNKNPKKLTESAEQARRGAKITWVIPPTTSTQYQKWGKIVNDSIEVLPPGV